MNTVKPALMPGAFSVTPNLANETFVFGLAFKRIWLATAGRKLVMISGAAIMVLIGTLMPGLAITATFTPLGDLSGGVFSSSAQGISADGTVVVGQSWTALGPEAFRWTSDGGMVGLGDLPGGNFQSDAIGASADGSVVVGDGWPATGSNGAFRWTINGGMVGLPAGSATGVSADGSVVIGSRASSPSVEAIRWTSENGTVGLGNIPGGNLSSIGRGISADGSVIVGVSSSAVASAEAFRWTESDGMVGLGDLAGSWFFSDAFAVSADGSTVVGRSRSAFGDEAFRWTEMDGMIGLGDLPGGEFFGVALDVSADGSVIIGRSKIDNPSLYPFEAFIWTEADGMQNLLDVLVLQGVTGLDGWTLVSASGISDDGRMIVGWGSNPSGDAEAWVATLTPVPIPAAAWLFATALGLVITLKRKLT